jgi:hypothetical protein
VVAAIKRTSPLAICALTMLLGAGAGLAAAPRVHGLDPFEVIVMGMAAGAALTAAVLLLDPAWILTAGLLLSVFSGNWSHISIPIPLDRIVIAIGLAAALARSLRPDGERIEIRGVHWLMLLLVLYAIASAAWWGTLTKHAPLFALLDRLGAVPFLLYLVAPVTFRTDHQRRILAIGLLVLGAYLSVITLFEAVGLRSLVIPQYILNPSLGIHAGRARGPFLEAGANGLAMFVCLVAAVITLTWWRDWRIRTAVVGVIVLCAAGILFTLTRQTWVGATGGAVAAMLASRQLRIWLPAVAVTVAVVVGLALALVPNLSQKVSHRTSQQKPVWDRLNSDSAALRMVQARPGLGFGWGRFGTASVPYYRLAKTYPLTSVGEAHNMPLSNASELGLAGAGLWAAILVAGIVAPALRRSRPEFEPWRVGLIAVAVAWFIQANFTPLDYAFDNYVVWLWAGVVVAGVTPRREPAIAGREQPVQPPAPAELEPVPA